MEENVKTLDRLYRDHHGIIVHVVRYEEDSQKVVYHRQGYEWECAAPLILFRSRFTRIDK